MKVTLLSESMEQHVVFGNCERALFSSFIMTLGSLLFFLLQSCLAISNFSTRSESRDSGGSFWKSLWIEDDGSVKWQIRAK